MGRARDGAVAQFGGSRLLLSTEPPAVMTLVNTSNSKRAEQGQEIIIYKNCQRLLMAKIDAQKRG